jgi:hypothetical protein
MQQGTTLMTPKEAADKIRPNFHLVSMPPEDRHHVLFVESVAAELGVEPTPFNLHQVAGALDDADIHGDDLHFPLMLYSRQHHAVEGVAASTYYPRHDLTFVTVENKEQLDALGEGWVENIADLPPRGDIPIEAPPLAKKELPDPDHHAGAEKWRQEIDRSAEVGAETRADEMKAEEARLEVAEKAAADERAKVAALKASEHAH